MQMRKVGSSSLEVSVVGLGCNTFGWQIDEAETRVVIDAALDAGITLLDTADMYGFGKSEEFIGRALGGRRDWAVVATKFGWGKGFGDNEIARGAPSYVHEAMDASLARLGMDHVDLYQYHRPDGTTPIVETLGAMDELVQQGKTRFIGCSNMNAAQIREAADVARLNGFTSFISAQNEYSWLIRDAEAELLPAVRELGIGFLPYFPLARGLLSGKYRRDQAWPEGTRIAPEAAPAEATWDRIEALQAFAERRGIGLLEVAIGGLAGNPAICSVIAGARTSEQVRANAAAGRWEPTVADLDELHLL